MTGLPVIRHGTRILDFDIENRPRTYWVPDRPTAEVTAIAACFVGQPKSMQVWLLRSAETDAEYDAVMREMLLGFREMYDAADLVTGHYVRRHDLPILNGGYMDMGLPILGPKLTQDTKLDMVSKADIPATQEYLADMLALAERKHHMSQWAWRSANRLTVEGRAKAEKRVTRDVRQHMKLRVAMLKAGLLKAPRVWRP